MNILLLGEFSGFHKNLQLGLKYLGHKVILVSSGDSFKKIKGDINTPLIINNNIGGKIKYRWQYFLLLLKLKDFDIVQLISTNVFPAKFFPYKIILQLLRLRNKKIFLIAAGSDSFYWTISRKLLRYGPFNDVLKYDLKKSKSSFESIKNIKLDTWVAKKVDGIIPSAYEYKIGYKEYNHLRRTIPLSMDLNSIIAPPNKINPPIKIVHGLSRYGFKGTSHVEAAFKILQAKYKNKIEVKIVGPLPLKEYLFKISQSNIIIDQTNTYSYGVNAVYGMAMGKVVLSGAEKECLKELNVYESPIINIRPDPNDIVEKVSQLIDDEKCIEIIGKRSREFVKEIHECRKIAKLFIAEWTK